MDQTPRGARRGLPTALHTKGWDPLHLRWQPRPREGNHLPKVTQHVGLDFFFSLGPHLQHIEVPRLGVESKLQLLAFATAIAMPDLSHICNQYHSSW